MDLYLRRVVHPQAHDNYRVILKDDSIEVEIGSIEIQHFRAAWDKFNADPVRLIEFLREKRKRLR
jgi:hypothetical protein